MNCSEISAVIVTKGDVDLSPIMESLPFDDVVIWDNSKEPVDRKVYGRYLGIERAKHDFIYVQDDDCIVNAFSEEDYGDKRIIGSNFDELYQDRIYCNVPSPEHRKAYAPLGISLVGWGAVFHRSLVGIAFRRYFESGFTADELFLRECDRVFTGLTRFDELDFPIQRLEYESAPNRMWTQPGHVRDLHAILERIAQVKAATTSWGSEASPTPTPSELTKVIDILFLAHNRLEFTKASFEALIANTNWDIARLVVYEDGSETEASEWLYRACNEVWGRSFRWTHCGGPVAIMADYLTRPKGPLDRTPGKAKFFAKIDNDVIVPPRWLDQCAATFEAHPELDLLGIEPPASRKPHFTQPFRRQPTHDLEMQKGEPGYVEVATIGGIGVFRRRAFENRPLIPEGPYGGFEAWQNRYPQVVRGWIKPALSLFLLDRLPIEPWRSLSQKYIAKGWQRKWRDYEMSDSHLWDWWEKMRTCSA